MRGVIFPGLRAARSYVPAAGLNYSTRLGLVSYWNLESVADSYGTNTLTNNNSVTFVAGKVGNAANFVSASSQTLSVSGTPFVLGSDWTVAGWLYLADFAAVYGILQKDSGVGGLNINIDAAGAGVTIRGFNGAGYQSADKVLALSTGTWYFFAGTYTAATKALTIDLNNSGTPATVTLTGSGLANPVANMILGNCGGATSLNGRLDSVGWWGSVLSATDLTAVYNGGAGRAWPF